MQNIRLYGLQKLGELIMGFHWECRCQLWVPWIVKNNIKHRVEYQAELILYLSLKIIKAKTVVTYVLLWLSKWRRAWNVYLCVCAELFMSQVLLWRSKWSMLCWWVEFTHISWRKTINILSLSWTMAVISCVQRPSSFFLLCPHCRKKHVNTKIKAEVLLWNLAPV